MYNVVLLSHFTAEMLLSGVLYLPRQDIEKVTTNCQIEQGCMFDKISLIKDVQFLNFRKLEIRLYLSHLKYCDLFRKDV